MKLDVLNFELHPTGLGGKQAKIFFDNNYGARVIAGIICYTDSQHPFELNVLKGTADDWCLTYDTPITDDGLERLTGEDVERLLDVIAGLPSA